MQKLKTKLGLNFNNIALIENAFVHRSYLNESARFKESNERLEYLGDAVLELVVTEYLFTKYPEHQEGMLTNLRASLVRTESLATLALDLGFPELILMSRGEESTGGRSNNSILANTLEAFLGALYLDQGIDVIRHLLDKYLFPRLDEIVSQNSYKDAKSLMQEIAQAKYKATPRYELVSATGPDHNKLFTVSAFIGDREYGLGTGKSKQEAQEAAAKATLEIITKN